jgi:hypothetical protein
VKQTCCKHALADLCVYIRKGLRTTRIMNRSGQSYTYGHVLRHGDNMRKIVIGDKDMKQVFSESQPVN